MSKQIKIAPELKQVIADIFYPIGSVYISVNDINPGTLFGGTWSRIVDGYLFCGSTGYGKGTQYNLQNGTITANTTLTVDQMPKHRHAGMSWWGDDTTQTITLNGGSQAGYNLSYSGGNNGAKTGFQTYESGGGKGHNHAIPSTLVAVWKRTA